MNLHAAHVPAGTQHDKLVAIGPATRRLCYDTYALHLSSFSRRGHFARYLGAAAFLHVGLMLWSKLHAAPTVVFAQAEEPATVIDVEQVPNAPARQNAPLQPGSSGNARAHSASRVRVAAGHASVTQGADSADGTWHLNTGAGQHIDTGIGQTMRLGNPGDAPPGPGANYTERSSPGQLNELLDAADIAPGMGRSGPVVLAMKEYVQQSGAMGLADFTVIIDKLGGASVEVNEARGDRVAWQDMRIALEQLLKNKSIRVPSSARAMKFAIRVEARAECPDGSSPLQGGGCSSVALTPSGLSLSPENTAAIPLRLVHARVLRETRLY